MKKFLKKIPSGVLSLVTLILICYVSLDDNPFEVNRIQLFYGADKVIHAIMYGFLTMVMIYEVTKYYFFFKPDWESYAFIIVINCLISILIELIQEVMEIGRHYDMYDIIANCSGVIIGFLLMKFILLNLIIKFMDTDDDYDY